MHGSAIALAYLLEGDTVKLKGQEGIPENRILNPDSEPKKLCIGIDLIKEAIDADRVTSNFHSAVPAYFHHLKDFIKLKNS